MAARQETIPSATSSRAAPLSFQRSDEYASTIIEGIELGQPRVIHGNVLNTGGLIANLPPNACVEVPVLVDATGLHPARFGPLPEQMAALDRAHISVHELMAAAVLDRDARAARHALLLDPLTAAVCSPDEIERAFRRDVARRARRPWLVRILVSGPIFTCVATSSFGLESIVRAEIEALGIADARTEDRRVVFSATPLDVARCNIGLRTADSVLIQAAEFPAPDFDSLYEGIRGAPWRDLLAPHAAVTVNARSVKSRLTALPSIQSVAKRAVLDGLSGTRRAHCAPEPAGAAGRGSEPRASPRPARPTMSR